MCNKMTLHKEKKNDYRVRPSSERVDKHIRSYAQDHGYPEKDEPSNILRPGAVFCS